MMKKTAIVLALLLIAGTACAGVSSVEDLKTAKVGTITGSAYEPELRSLMGENAENLFTYEHFADVISALKEGKIDAVVMDSSFARYFVQEDEKLKILDDSLGRQDYAIAFKKDSPLKDEVDNALRELKNAGVVPSIISKYRSSYEYAPIVDMNRGATGGLLWVGCAASFPPYDMRNDFGFTGIDIEICSAIAKKLNRELVMVDYNFDNLPRALEDGRIDMICSAFMVTDARKAVMDFSVPYDSASESVIVRNE